MKSGSLIRKFQLTFQEKYFIGEFVSVRTVQYNESPLLMEVWERGSECWAIFAMDEKFPFE